MLKIIKEREYQVIKEYSIEYRYKDDPEAGFSFPATCHGDPDFDQMGSEMRANYEACLTNPRLTEAEFVESERTFVAPAIGQCRCGEAIELYGNNAYGAVRCPRCGQWYNLFGQALRDPEYWEDEYFDDWPETVN